MRAQYPRIASDIQEAASWARSKVLWPILLDMWCVDLIIMHTFPIQAEALCAKTVYPGCHCSCRLVKLTARILYPFISSPTYHTLVREAGFSTSATSTVIWGQIIFVELTALRRTREHVMFEQAATVKTLLSETTSNQSGCGTSWTSI